MNYNRIGRLFVGLLLLVMLAACGGSETTPGGATPAGTATESAAGPTQQPTDEGIETPSEVATAEPTVEPTEEQPTITPIAGGSEATPTAAGATPTASQETPSGAQGLLPRDAVWVFSRDTFTALAPDMPEISIADQLGEGGVSGVAASPDGRYVAYSLYNELKLLDISSGESRSVASGESVVSPVFAPDGSRLVYTNISIDGSELRLLDLNSGEDRTLLSTGQREPGYLPIAWNQEGIFVHGVIWGSDAPPQGLFLVQPESGELETLYNDSFQRAIPAPEGRRVALVQGEVPLGEGTANLGISILDPQAGGVAQVLPETEIWISTLAWSRDGQRLLYTSAPTQRDPVTTVHIVALDGGEEQQTNLEELGVRGGLRDAAWQQDNLLLLVAGDDGLIHVLQMPAQLAGATPQELGEVEGSTQPGVPNRLIYLPGR